MTTDIFNKIIKSYNDLTKSETIIADYILNNKSQIKSFTVHSIASHCNVGAATVTRFCHSIGYNNFNEFKFGIAENIYLGKKSSTEKKDDLYGKVHPSDSIEQKCQKLCNISKQALNQTLEQLDSKKINEAVTLLRNAKNVYCFGQGNSSIVAMDAYGRFISVSSKFHWVSDTHLQIDTSALLNENDVILYFSFSGSTRELSEIGEITKGTKAKLILITRFPNSPGAAFADLLLICGANESAHQQGSIAIKISQLFIIDVLYNEYCALEAEATSENRKKTLNATSKLMI